MSTPVAVGAFVVLAAVGTTLRVQAIARWEHEGRPVGTLVVNLAGSLLAGLVVGAGSSWTTPLVAGGAGALTTFSTFVAEVVSLVQHGRPRLAAGYLGMTLGACTALAWVGLTLAGG